MFEVEDVLKKRDLAQQKSMTDTMAAEDSSSQMVCITSLTGVRSKEEGVEASLFSPDVERSHVGKQIVDPVAVRGILFRVPDLWYRELLEQSAFRLTLVIDAVESNDSLQEDVEFGVASRVFGNFKQRLEEIDDDLFKIVHQAGRLVDVEEARHLDQPSDVVGKQLVVDDPSGKLVPLVYCASIYRDTPFGHLVFARLEIRDHFFSDLGEVSAIDEVVRLEEDGS